MLIFNKRQQRTATLAATTLLWLAGTLGVRAADHGAAVSDGSPLQAIVVGQPRSIRVRPAAVLLSSVSQRVQLVVSGDYADGRTQDLTRSAEFHWADPALAEIADAYLTPLATGKTELTVQVGGLEQKVPVEVLATATAERVSFLYGTLAALSKNHCNSGACHGAPSGKGGFALSMVAFDPEADKLTLTRDFLNRRTNVLEPETSLLLRKPLMEIGHRGGQRLRTSDESYRLLVDWIRQGCQFDPADQPFCTGIGIEPAADDKSPTPAVASAPSSRELRWPAHTQQLRVSARFADGSQRDVTRLAMYVSSDETLATVSPNGLVVGNGRGQAAISVRFLNHVESVYLTFVRDVEGFRWPNPPEANFIDRLVYTRLRQLQYQPAGACTDEEFLRRVHLDAIGLLPSGEATEAFLADKSLDKRSRLIDALLERGEFARFWAMKWGDLLRIQPTTVGEEGVHKYYRWLVRAWETNLPYDQFARALLTGEGNTYENPTANYYRVTADTSETTEMTAQVFLGARMTCAKCHNHPFDRWTQDNYYGLGAFFERIRRKPTAKTAERIIYVARRGENRQPRTGKDMKPWVPDRGELDLPADANRLHAFADWLTCPDNPFFARMEANRIWSQLLGRGIIDPVDDMRDSNPPSNPELLDALTRDFVEHRFDRKQLIRTILNSHTYQASSKPTPLNAGDEKYFSHARQQLLTAEQLLDALSTVTGSMEPFGNLPMGTMATQLPAPPKSPAAEFLVAFGQPPRQSSCACERQSSAGLTQTLQLFNGVVLSSKIGTMATRLRDLVAKNVTDDEIVSRIYLAALCRRPKESELQEVRQHIAEQPDRLAALQDVVWCVLNTREFLYRR